MQSGVDGKVRGQLQLSHRHLAGQELVHSSRQNGHGDVGLARVFVDPGADEDVAGGHLPFTVEHRPGGSRDIAADAVPADASASLQALVR